VRQSAYTVATCDDHAAGEACFATLEARELVANQRFGGLTQGEACHRRPDLRTPTWDASTRRLATCHQSSTRFATLGTPWQPRHSDCQQMGGRPVIGRRTNVVGIFPDRASDICLVSSLVIDQTEEWAEQRRYMNLEAPRKVQRVSFADADDGTEDTLPT